MGGGVVTREVNVPGFKHDIASTHHVFIQTNPIVLRDELGLFSKYGVKYIDHDPQVVINFPDDRSIVFWRDVDKTCESIAQFSTKDAKAYKRFYEWALPGLEMLVNGIYSPPPPLSALFGLMEGNEAGRELKRAMLLSTLDICEDWFESDAVKIALTRFVSEIVNAPQTKGTGIMLYLFIPYLHRYGAKFPEGGSGALSEALERCLKANGGTVMLNSPIKTFKVEHGKATGVVLESGEEILADKLVASNLSARQMFVDMIAPEDLPADVPAKIQRLKDERFCGFPSGPRIE